MIIRKYRQEDCPAIAQLFYDTVHIVNAKDYSPEQLDVWATGKVDLEKWNSSFLEHYTLVSETDGIISGFGDIAVSGDGGLSVNFGAVPVLEGFNGYLDRLYVHKDFQNKGIATAICDGLERINCFKKITTHASITARPFFEKRGYIVVKEQMVERGGVYLANFVMEKV